MDERLTAELCSLCCASRLLLRCTALTCCAVSSSVSLTLSLPPRLIIASTGAATTFSSCFSSRHPHPHLSYDVVPPTRTPLVTKEPTASPALPSPPFHPFSPHPCASSLFTAIRTMSFSNSLAGYWRALEFGSVSEHCLESISSSSFCCLPFLHLWPFSRGEYADLDAHPQATTSSWAPPASSSSSSSFASAAPLPAPVALPVFSSHLASSTFSSPDRLSQSLALSTGDSARGSEWRPSDVLLYGDDELPTTPVKATKKAKKPQPSAAQSAAGEAGGKRTKPPSQSKRASEKGSGGRRGAPPMSPSPPPSTVPARPSRSSSRDHRDEDASSSSSSSDDEEQRSTSSPHQQHQHERALPALTPSKAKSSKAKKPSAGYAQ